MFKKLTLFLFVLFVFFNFNINVVSAEPISISEFGINYFKNLPYTDNTWLPTSYLNGTYDNYAMFYTRLFGGSTSANARYLYVFCYNKTYGIEPFYLTSKSSTTLHTGYNIKTVVQYSAENLTRANGCWYRCYIQDSPTSITWTECSDSAVGFDYNSANVYLSSTENIYTVSFLKYDYKLNGIYRVDGKAQTYSDDTNRYTIYMTYLFGTGNIYLDDGLNNYLYSSRQEYDFYDDYVNTDTDTGTGGGDDIDYGSGGVFGWIADFFKTLIDKVADIPGAIGKFFENLVSVVVSIPLTIINLLSELLQFLFVPNSEFFADIKEEFIGKFEFAFQIIDLSSNLVAKFDNASDSIPSFSVTLYNKKFDIIDFSMFSQYRSLVHGIIIAISYYNFVMWLIRNVPSVVHGFGNMDRG